LFLTAAAAAAGCLQLQFFFFKTNKNKNKQTPTLHSPPLTKTKKETRASVFYEFQKAHGTWACVCGSVQARGYCPWMMSMSILNKQHTTHYGCMCI
jgi:hypothetical protein